MSILTLPALPAATVDWQFSGGSQVFPAEFAASENIASLPGRARMVAVLTWKLLARSDAADLEAALAELDGPAGRFYLGNQARMTPRGTPVGAPVVDGAANHGGLLTTRGWTASAAGVLKRGDFFAVGEELKMVVGADVDADAGGLASIRFRPWLRAVPPDGTAIVTSSPVGVFRLLDDEQVKFAYRKQTGDYQITAVEAWA